MFPPVPSLQPLAILCSIFRCSCLILWISLVSETSTIQVKSYLVSPHISGVGGLHVFPKFDSFGVIISSHKSFFLVLQVKVSIRIQKTGNCSHRNFPLFYFLCSRKPFTGEIGLYQKKSTPPRRMERWKFSREGGGRGFWKSRWEGGLDLNLFFGGH